MALLICQGCGKELRDGGLKYVIEIKSFADFDGYIEEYPGDVEEGINELLDAMEKMERESVEGDVYKEQVYLVCKSCRDRFTKAPFQTGGFEESKEVKGTVH